MNEIHEEDFGGVYYFTNPTKKVRTFLWNSKEYTFEPESRSPVVIRNETSDSCNEIRKKWAYKLALERLYEGELVKDREGNVVFDYNKNKDMGNGMPPTFDDKILEPFIEECLKPLPLKRASVKEGKKVDSDTDFKVTQAVSTTANLNEVFKEDPIPVLGQMPDHA